MKGRREDLGLMLITITRRYRRVMDAALTDFGLTEASTLPLRYLARLGQGIRQKDLAEALDIEGPTLVRLLDQLSERGLIARVECPEDRRAKRISVTEAGRALHRAFNARLDPLRARLLADVQAEEITATLALLGKLEAALQADSGRRAQTLAPQLGADPQPGADPEPAPDP